MPPIGDGSRSLRSGCLRRRRFPSGSAPYWSGARGGRSEGPVGRPGQWKVLAGELFNCAHRLDQGGHSHAGIGIDISCLDPVEDLDEPGAEVPQPVAWVLSAGPWARTMGGIVGGAVAAGEQDP